MRAGKPQKQAVAIAYSEKRKAQHKSNGGKIMEQDSDALMEYCAQECMKAIREDDLDSFKSSLRALVMDIVMECMEQGDEQ